MHALHMARRVTIPPPNALAAVTGDVILRKVPAESGSSSPVWVCTTADAEEGWARNLSQRLFAVIVRTAQFMSDGLRGRGRPLLRLNRTAGRNCADASHQNILTAVQES